VIKMAKTDILSIRIEPELKKNVEETLNDLGMNIADAVTIFLKQVVLTESIPFEIKKPKKYNKETLNAIKEAKKIAKNPDKYKIFNNVEELMEDLNSEDE
jgi:DNA-damage-inducible protein J